jgi:hypothetical protein
MTFVTIKHEGYSLLATTPSGRAGLGLSADQKRLDFLRRRDDRWEVLRSWPVDDLSHTEAILRLGKVEEPERPEELLALLPSPRGLH